MKKTLALFFAAATLFASCKKDDEKDTVRYTVTTETATAEWKGYLRTGYYNQGSIGVESSDLETRNGVVTKGRFTMPLLSLKNYNLPTDSLKAMLIHHLQSADFFNMALHPRLEFSIKSVSAYKGRATDTNIVAGANYQVSGSLTLVGKALDISFPAKISTAGSNIYIAALVKVDRTKWGIHYAADPALPAEQHILPVIDIKLNVKGTKR